MQERTEIDLVYTRRETAQRLRISLRTLSRMERDKKMPPRIRLSDRIYGYRQSAIENYLSARTA
jgi:predicted DNA-binding transcriptional regulator AlpA